MLKKMVSITLCVTIMFNVLLFAANASSKTDTSESAILYEDEAKRNLYEKHFVCSDGTYLAVSYPDQVCYRDKNNEWQLIDNKLSFENDKYIATSADYSIAFPYKYSDMQGVDFKQNDNLLSWGITLLNKDINETIANVVENKNGNDILAVNNIESHVNYYGLSKGIDLCYTVLPNRVKENIILNEQTDFSGYQMHIKKNGLIPVQKEDNSIEFVDNSNNTVFD